MVDVASALIDGRDIPIVFTGIRPGEKIHEIMVSEEECHRTIERDGYYVICPMLPECGPESVNSAALTRRVFVLGRHPRRGAGCERCWSRTLPSH